MRYWVKEYEKEDFAFTEYNDRVLYTFKRYVGPFKHLSDAEEVIDNDYSDWEIIEFDG